MKKYSNYITLGIALVISLLIILNKDWFLSLGNYGYFGLFIMSMAGNATVFVPVPYFPIVFAAGSTLNPIALGLLSGLGSAIGELTSYFVGRSGYEITTNKKQIDRAKEWMKKYGLFTIFFLSAVPNFVFDIAGMIAGATKIPVWKFLLMAFLGKSLRYLLVAYLGQMVLF